MKIAGFAVIILALGAVLWLVMRPGGVAARFTGTADDVPPPAPAPPDPSRLDQARGIFTSGLKTGVNFAIAPITGPIGWVTGFHL